MKSGKRPGESREGNTAIHHWIFLDIRKVIECDEAMPDYLRIDPKRYYRQAEQDQKVGSLKCCSSACVSSATGRTRRGELAFARAENGIFLPRCGVAPVFSLLRGLFCHALCDSIRAPNYLQKAAKETKTVFCSDRKRFAIFVSFC